ncbi:MAG: polyphosphate polymerase domain-containing protein [Clostridiales bacterium]|nr:polyphosphate polymerase domain-containing protein [Clostridiales bacterium]
MTFPSSLHNPLPQLLRPEEGRLRHELKALCGAQELAILRSRLTGLMAADSHADENGRYRVRSLYFDDMDNTCMRENEAGVDDRRKYRLRLYNGSADRITLEIKSKVKGLTGKRGCALTREQCELLMRGRPPALAEGTAPELRRLCLLMRTRRMRPAVIVEYERTVFLAGAGNVRVTLDENIGGTSRVDRFLNSRLSLFPVLPPGQHILEVKYDGFLPDVIADTLQLGRLSRTSFSKYYLCRTNAPLTRPTY